NDPAGKFRLGASHGGDARAMFPAEGDQAFATLWIDVRTAGLELPQPYRIRLGDRLELPKGYHVTVHAATRDYRPGRDSAEKGPGDARPLAEQPDGFRAVWLEIESSDGREPERRLISEITDPVDNGDQQDFHFSEVVVHLRWDRWTEAGSPRFVLSWDATGNAQLLPESGAGVAVHVGDTLDLPGETKLVLKGLFERARLEKSIEFIPGRVEADGFDPSFYESDARGIVLDVVHFPRTSKQTVETVRLATSGEARANLWQSGDDRIAIQFVENDEGFPFDWRSLLKVVEKDAAGNSHVVDCGTPKEREIRVNDYFKYKGYRFFQTNADPKRPGYSGIGVVYDPGIEFVLLGMYTIIAGTVLAFIVRPIVRAQKRAKVNA
ncbi:MAG TPA: hypothetical protein VM509_10420, partial [Planctomycetota bacterium]|nr:hypothetical protein [Planctomycetota bacterium]